MQSSQSVNLDSSIHWRIDSFRFVRTVLSIVCILSSTAIGNFFINPSSLSDSYHSKQCLSLSTGSFNSSWSNYSPFHCRHKRKTGPPFVSNHTLGLTVADWTEGGLHSTVEGKTKTCNNFQWNAKTASLLWFPVILSGVRRERRNKQKTKSGLAGNMQEMLLSCCDGQLNGLYKKGGLFLATDWLVRWWYRNRTVRFGIASAASMQGSVVIHQPCQ